MNYEVLLLSGLAAIATLGLSQVLLAPFLAGEHKVWARQKAFVSTGKNPNSTEDAIQVRLKETSRVIADGQGQSGLHAKIQEKLDGSGLGWSVNKFVVFSLVVGALSSVLALILTKNIFITICVFLVATVILPNMYVSFKAKRRINKFLDEFPNAVDVIVRGLKAGLPLGDSLKVIANEAAEPVKSEFAYIVDIQNAGLPLSDAVKYLHTRMPLPETNFFSIVIAIQSKSGGNLSEALGNLSKVIRDRRKMKQKIDALSNEAKASASIVGSLPILFMLLLTVAAPDYISYLFNTMVGNIVLAGSFIWMCIGIFVMKRMIEFDF